MLINNLENKIHYKFKDINLLKEALIHSSHLSNHSQKNIKNYERLEFLGDRVLGLVLAEYFFKLFPDANEGLLNGYLQKYANQNTLAEYANKINLSNFIKFQKGDSLEFNKSVLSDVVESIIGSIYLDTNFNNSRKFIINEIINQDSIQSEPIKHPKSLLQEYCLDKYKCLPKYTFINKTGTDHQPKFLVSVSVNNVNNVVSEGPSLKIAEEAAAFKLINILKI
ncbi:ribonuclease III [Alphaproteobacteria bacterium]|nr:ribonuclease III [Alphaproteobacteria bacterium]